MNYIKHLNHWMELLTLDDRLSPHHVSLYLALFQQWNKSHFSDKITIFRNEVLQVSKIGSSKTYYKCLHELHEYGYIRYLPSCNPMKGSAIIMVDLSEYSIEDKSNDIAFISGADTPSSIEKDKCSASLTQTLPGQKVNSKPGKNDTGRTQVVTPFKKNNLNNENSEQTAREIKSKSSLSEKSQSAAYRAGEKKKKHGKASGNVSKKVADGNALKSRTSFSPPSRAEVEKFFSGLSSSTSALRELDAKKLEVEAVKFFHHFESNGWMVGGKSPMHNWEAACRAWIARIPEFERSNKTPSRLHHLHAEGNGHFNTSL